MELRKKEHIIDYKKMNANGKDKTIDFDITKEMTPVKSRYLKKGKGGRKHEEHNSEEDTSDENVLDDESDVEDSDEELKDMKIELGKLKNEKKKRKLAEKKKKIQKQIEAEKKGLQKQKKREQGDLTCKDKKLKSAKKKDTYVTIDDLRGDKQIKAKAQKKVRKILELSSSESDIDTSENESESENSYISDSGSAACSEDVKGSNYKKHKKCKQSKSKKKSGIFDRPSDEVVKKQLWPQAKLQFEYAGSKVSFEDLEFNLFVAGELEIISSRNIDKVEKNGRIKLLKKIAYYFELYEWNGIKKLYAHIIRQIENGVATWKHDFSEVETPLLIKYVKSEQKSKIREKREVKKEETVFYCSYYQRKKCSQSKSHMGKIKGTERYFQHICATCWRKDQTKMYHPESDEICPHQGA